MSISGVGEANRAHLAVGALQEPTGSPDDVEASLAFDGGGPGTSYLMLEGDIGAQIAALTILTAQKQRRANLELQVKEEAAIERAEAAQVRAMHEQADDIRWAGLVDGVFGMGTGVFQLAGAVSESDSAHYAAGAALSEGIGKGLGAIPRGEEADDRADATSHEHEAAHHRRAFDASRDAVREGQDLLESALDFYKQSQQSAAEAVQTSVRRG